MHSHSYKIKCWELQQMYFSPLHTHELENWQPDLRFQHKTRGKTSGTLEGNFMLWSTGYVSSRKGSLRSISNSFERAMKSEITGWAVLLIKVLFVESLGYDFVLKKTQKTPHCWVGKNEQPVYISSCISIKKGQLVTIYH